MFKGGGEVHYLKHSVLIVELLFLDIVCQLVIIQIGLFAKCLIALITLQDFLNLQF